MTTIRTPDDENTTPGYFYLPVTPGWWYEGQTYAGHSDFSVDWNRRTKDGGWIQDEGDPVFASASGKVADVVKSDGYVLLEHDGGYATEYRHMTDIPVAKGDKVTRGERIGRIGNVAGTGRSTAPHLHTVHYRNGQRIQQRIEGKPIVTSVKGSDTKPSTWSPPAPVRLQGPPARATWESAAKEAIKALDKAEDKIAGLSGQLGAAQEAERLARTAADELAAANQALKVRITELENATPPDCTVAVERAKADTRAADIAALQAAPLP